MSTARTVSRCTALAIALLAGLGSASPVDAQIFGHKDPCGCPTCPPHFFWKHKQQPYGRACDCDLPCATECSGPPTGPFFGYYPTCWHRWPNGFQNCPVTDWEARGDGCGLPMEGHDMIGPPVPKPEHAGIISPTHSGIGGGFSSPVIDLGQQQTTAADYRFASGAARLPATESLVLEQVPAAAVPTAWESNEPRQAEVAELAEEVARPEAGVEQIEQPIADVPEIHPEQGPIVEESAPAIIEPEAPLPSTKGKTLREIIAERRGKLQPVRPAKPQQGNAAKLHQMESASVQPFTANDAQPVLELESQPRVEAKPRTVFVPKKSRAKVAHEPEVAQPAPVRSNGLRSAQMQDRVNPLRR